MTPPMTDVAGMIEVTQADRDAAADMADLVFAGTGVGKSMRVGAWDKLGLVQAFALHRTEAIRSLAERNAELERELWGLMQELASLRPNLGGFVPGMAQMP